MAAYQTNHRVTIGKDGHINPPRKSARNADSFFSEDFSGSNKHMGHFPELLSLFEINAMKLGILPAFVWIVFKCMIHK